MFGRRMGGISTAGVCSLVVMVCLMAVAFYVGTGQRRAVGQYQQQLAENRLAAEVRSAFQATVEAEKSAVMADSDEASVAYAREADDHAAALDRHVEGLSQALAARGASVAQQQLGDFLGCWTQLRETDRRILDLAVQNTNLKAAKLSHHQAMQQLDALAYALSEIKARVRGKPKEAALCSAADAVLLAAQRVQTLHAPHIDEAQPALMDAMEKSMALQQETIRNNLEVLKGSVPSAAAEAMQAAVTAAEQHAALTAEIVALSRRNTNVESLALSMGIKRRMATECSGRLAALQETLAAPRLKATR